MGGRAGGGASGGMGSRSRGGLANRLLSGSGVTDAELKRSLSEAIAQFDKEFGLPENVTITMKDLGSQIGGSANGLNQVKINSGYQDGRFDKSDAKKTLLHEFTHVLDKTDTHHSANISGIKMKGATPVGQLKSEYKVFDKKLTAACKHFKANYGSTSTKQIGRYALKSKHEFFAEAVASHMTGTKNNYTTFAYNLAKSMSGK